MILLTGDSTKSVHYHGLSTAVMSSTTTCRASHRTILTPSRIVPLTPTQTFFPSSHLPNALENRYDISKPVTGVSPAYARTDMSLFRARVLLRMHA
jgi:hypothetical protein